MLSTNQITKLYVATFNRAPDAAGLAYWMSDGTSNTTSLTDINDIARAMQAGAEASSGVSSMSDSDYVISLYSSMFCRSVSSTDAGVLYWVGEMGDGSVDRANLIQTLILGAEASTGSVTDAAVLANKTTVGLAFANAGLNDVDLAQTVMDVVDENESTVTLAQQLITSVTASSGTLSYEDIVGSTSYMYNTDYTDSTFADGTDSMHKMVFNANGSVTHTNFYGAFGASGWASEEAFEFAQTWSIVNGKLVITTVEGENTFTDTLTYVTQSGGQSVYNDAGVGRNLSGTVIDQYNSLTISYADMPNPRSEAEILSEGFVKEILAGDIGFIDANGIATTAPSDARIQLQGPDGNFNTIDGIVVNADGSFSKTIYGLGNVFNDDTPLNIVVYSDVNSDSTWESDDNTLYEPFYLMKDTTVAGMQSTLPNITLVNGGSYYPGAGVTSSGGVDFEVCVFGASADVSAMLGARADSAFIINIHSSGADQTVIGTSVNDAFMWHGGNDTFDGGSDGGNWGNGGSDFASVNVTPAASSVQINTSQPNVISFSDNGTVLVTLTKNQDGSGSFDAQIASSGDVLHLVNTEVFRLYVVPENTDSSYNITVDLIGNQTGTFDAHF